MGLIDDHRAAMAEVLAASVLGATHIIGGATVAAMIHAPETGLEVLDIKDETKRVALPAGTIAVPVRGQVIVIDGQRWEVGQVRSGSSVLSFDIHRNLA